MNSVKYLDLKTSINLSHILKCVQNSDIIKYEIDKQLKILISIGLSTQNRLRLWSYKS